MTWTVQAMKDKKKTRRALSFKAEVYVALRRFCERNGRVMTSFAEAAVLEALESEGITPPNRDDALRQLIAWRKEDSKHDRRSSRARRAASNR